MIGDEGDRGIVIAFLSGILAYKCENLAVINVGGVGFNVNIPLTVYRELPRVGEPVTLHTHLIVREDDLSLYGFLSTEDREVFLILLGVSGVGAKMATDVISHLPVNRLVESVQKGESVLLCQVPGIGKKRAEKLIFELKRSKHPILLAPISTRDGKKSPALPENERVSEAIAALEALGCKPYEAYRAISEAVEQLGTDAEVSQLIKEGLRHR